MLLDELAAGTDPVEGSALAQALLARLAGQARLTVVTTHYPELKEWASATEGVANAATGFDPETHAPLYRVALGRPGTSHALQIAERLGLDAAVVADARARVAPERLRTTELLAEAEAAERRRPRTREAAGGSRQRRRALARARASGRPSSRPRSSRCARRRRGARGRARRRPSASWPRRARSSRRCARRSAPPAAASASAARDAGRRPPAGARARPPPRRSVRAGGARRAGAARGSRPPAATAPLAAGDPVEAPELGVRGTIVAIEGDEAEVLGPGGLRVRIPLARLRARPRQRAPDEQPEPAVRIVASARGDVPDELDVRGLRAQEAREAVRSFVDDAALAGLTSVRVVHGRGTGAVRSGGARGAHRAHARRAPRVGLGRRRHARAPRLVPLPAT